MKKGNLCEKCHHNNGALTLNGKSGVACRYKGEFIQDPWAVTECKDYWRGYRKEPFLITDMDLHNVMVEWLLDTDTDSVCEAVGPVFGVKLKLFSRDTETGDIVYRATPIKGQYMDGLEYSMLNTEKEGS